MQSPTLRGRTLLSTRKKPASWTEIHAIMSPIKRTGHDTFAYDPLPGLEFSMKDEIAGMLGGQLTPEQVGTDIQTFISTN